MTAKNDLQTFLDKHHPWGSGSNVIWLATTLKLTRNLSKYLFATKLDKNSQKQVAKLVLNALGALPNLKFPLLLQANTMGPTEKQVLFEQFLATESFQQVHDAESFAIDDMGRYFAILNLHDHLQLQYNDASGEIEQAWNQLAHCDTELCKVLNFAFSTRFGFLVSHPFQCGTGLSAHLYLHLPGLIHAQQLAAVLEKCADERVKAEGLQGKLDEPIGDIVALTNCFHLGITEEEIIGSLRSFATKLIVEEKSVRNKLKSEAPPALKNRVSRAFGLLLHSYELDTSECLGAISLCKLGADLEWISGIDQRDLNRLLFECHRGHIQSKHGGQLPQTELAIKRAHFMHEALKKAQLNI